MARTPRSVIGRSTLDLRSQCLDVLACSCRYRAPPLTLLLLVPKSGRRSRTRTLLSPRLPRRRGKVVRPRSRCTTMACSHLSLRLTVCPSTPTTPLHHLLAAPTGCSCPHFTRASSGALFVSDLHAISRSSRLVPSCSCRPRPIRRRGLSRQRRGRIQGAPQEERAAHSLQGASWHPRGLDRDDAGVCARV